jgi:chromosome segregation ATPase
MAEPWTETTEETVALLLEEIARLEAELRARDDADRVETPNEPIAAPVSPDPALLRQIEELTAELAGRDETITVLLEQAELFEQAATAQRAEWDQLHQWVQEVEQRVEGKDSREADLEAELLVERRRGEAQRQSMDVERKAAETRRNSLEREIEDLRAKVSRHQEGISSDGIVEELERENRWLRDARARLEQAASASNAVGPLTERLDTALRELDEVKKNFRLVSDEQRREKNEYEAELSAMRSQYANESAQKKAVEEEAARNERQGSAIEADERIRAFREHLRELHKTEAEQRAGRSLASRLSRLWRSTGPG